MDLCNLFMCAAEDCYFSTEKDIADLDLDPRKVTKLTSLLPHHVIAITLFTLFFSFKLDNDTNIF
jgi:hypothetical protein